MAYYYTKKKENIYWTKGRDVYNVSWSAEIREANRNVEYSDAHIQMYKIPHGKVVWIRD